MADTTLNVSPVLSVCATLGERVKELTIKDGQLIFVQDKHKIAFDFNGKRRFYNQIEELSTELDRTSLLAPISGMYYFVIETAVLWTYQGKWIQITSKPEEIVFIGTEMPELGKAQTLYVTTADGAENISVWDESLNGYKVVADKTQEVSDEDIEKLFQ
jgi:hypothetical protein